MIDLNGQLKPLLLEWKTASHFARTNNAEIAWLDVNQTGPEFVARAQGIEWEVECKRQSYMILEVLGDSEADHLAEQLIRRVLDKRLQGELRLEVPLEFEANTWFDSCNWTAALDGIAEPGEIDIELPGALCLKGDLRPASGNALNAKQWQAEISNRKLDGGRIYAHARAVEGMAVDPVHLQMISPKRAGVKLIEYLWERKFGRAATQCSGERGAMLIFEWESIDSPMVFMEDELFTYLIGRTFDEHRHVAAIAMRCDSAPTSSAGSLDYSVGAFLTKSKVTNFPEVAQLVRLTKQSQEESTPIL